MEIVMGINVGMLIFGLFNGGLAYAIVFSLIKSGLKGGKLGRILGTILGIIIFTAYLAVFIRINTPGVSVNPDFRNILYAAPIVLTVLLTALVLLSQPPKTQEADEEETDGESGAYDNGETASDKAS